MKRAIAAVCAVFLLLAIQNCVAAKEMAEAELVLQKLLAAEQAGEMQQLANWLETYNLEERQVKQLIAAAEATSSEERRNLLWHAIRCTRSQTGRVYLERQLEDSTRQTQLRFLRSLQNLAPFDLPLLIGLYQAAAEPDSGAVKISEQISRPESDVGDAMVQLATRETTSLAEPLSAPPDFLPELGQGSSLLHQHRPQQAKQGKADLLVWIAKNARLERHRLAVILPAYDLLDSDHQKRLAKEILALVKVPEERARVMPLICKRYGIDLVPYLVRDDESETTKLGILNALHELGSSYGYSMSAISHGQNTFQYVSENDPSPKVREAAARLVHRLSGKKLRGPSEEPPK